MIVIGSDHGGFLLKEEVKKYLDDHGVAYEDFGTLDGATCDYPVIAKRVALAVASGNFKQGLLFCGTGIGVSITANKIKGIRAVCNTDSFSVRHSRLHNDANILCLGGRVVGPGLANELVDIFLNTNFEGGRHKLRCDMIEE